MEFFMNQKIKLYQDDIYEMAYSNDKKLSEYLSYILRRGNIKIIKEKLCLKVKEKCKINL